MKKELRITFFNFKNVSEEFYEFGNLLIGHGCALIKKHLEYEGGIDCVMITNNP